MTVHWNSPVDETFSLFDLQSKAGGNFSHMSPIPRSLHFVQCLVEPMHKLSFYSKRKTGH